MNILRIAAKRSTWFVAGMLAALAIAEQPDNGDFERQEHRPQGWEPRRWGGTGSIEYEHAGRGGGWCVAISSEAGGDLSWTTRAKLTPYARYRLSAWIKTRDVLPQGGRGALINLHDGPGAFTPALTGTNDWTQVFIEFDSGPHETVTINCLFGGWGLVTGKAWYDDVKLEMLHETLLSPAITVDAAQTGPPISKYIYGQFIEHLGRCIYGGIWAEMLEDRKFFYPVGAPESPWKPIGNPAGVITAADGAYVAEHSIRVEPPSALSQSGLGLLKNKRYVGRAVLSGDGDVTVRLYWGERPGDHDTATIRLKPGGWNTYPLNFRAKHATDDGRIEFAGSSPFSIGAVSLMPADHVDGMRSDTLALLKALNAPIYRWPGGNFVSGYDWRDGIGDPDKRPPRKNPAWQGVEHNDFGIHEFMNFCEAVNAEPYIVVNSGLGDVQLARDQVEYVNGPADTPMGAARLRNGRKEPWRCVWWGIGNEMYGGWQLGHMPLADYVKKHIEFADTMRAVDPGIRLVAVGATGVWSETMLRDCADHMDLLSEHFYCGEKPGIIEHVRQLADNVRAKAEAHRGYLAKIPSLRQRPIPIALDEWNYWYGPHVFGELGTRYFLKDGLGVAAALHEMTRHADLFFMANYAQTVNVIGAIKTTKTAAAFETTGLVLKMYREHYGQTPVNVTGDYAPLNVAAAWSDDRRRLTLGVVNPLGRTLSLKLAVDGADLAAKGESWRIAGSDPMAYNDPGMAEAVRIEGKGISLMGDALEVPPFSASIFAIPARPTSNK